MGLTLNQTTLMFATYNGGNISIAQEMPLQNIISHNSTIESDTRYWGPDVSAGSLSGPPAQPIPTTLNNPSIYNNPIALNYVGKANVRTIVTSTPYGNFSLTCNGSQILFVSGAGEMQAKDVKNYHYIATAYSNGGANNFNQVVSNTQDTFSLVNMYEIQYAASVAAPNKWLYVNYIAVK